MPSLNAIQNIDGLPYPAYERRPLAQLQPSQQHFVANQRMLYADTQEWCCTMPRSSSTSLAESSLAPGMPYVAQAPTTPPHEIGDQEDTAVPRAHNHFQKSFRMFGESYPLRALDLA
ncbi:hypothetical protein AAVH_43424 [Aphelenchoides avenae]|nr:hypothetical protein AAVH_43424 [Aphelenchus avenae]